MNVITNQEAFELINQKSKLETYCSSLANELKSSATIDKKEHYSKRIAAFKIDTDSEAKATRLGRNLKDKKRSNQIDLSLIFINGVPT